MFLNRKNSKSHSIEVMGKDVLDAVGEEVMILSTDLTVQYANKVLLRSAGLSEDEMVGKKCYEITHNKKSPCEKPQHECPVKKVKEGNPVSCEHVHYGADGNKKNVIVTVYPIKEEGAITGYVHVSRDVTRWKTQKEEYEKLFEFSRDAIITLISQDWKIESANRAAVQMFGANSAEDLISKSLWDISPKKQPDGELSGKKAKEMLNKALEEGSAFFEWRHKRLNGEGFPTTVLLSRSDMADREILQATIRDITERKKHERELEIIKQAVESSAEAVYITDTDGNITYVNSAFEDITGYTLEEAVGENPHIMNSGQMPNSYFEKLWSTLLSGDIWEEEVINKRKNGELYTAYQTISPIVDENGDIKAFVAVQNDITEQKEAEEKLRKSEEKFRGIFEGSPDPTFLLDEKGVFTDFNKAAIEQTGYDKDEIVGKNLGGVPFFTKESTEKVVENFKNRKKGEEIPPYEVELRTKDDEKLFIEINVKKFEEEGVFNGELVIGRDVTRRKQAQEELKKAYEGRKEVLERSPFGIYIVNSGGDIDYSNKAMLEISGDTEEQFRGLNVFELSAYEETGLSDKIKSCIEAGEEFRLEGVEYTSEYGNKTTVRNFTGMPFDTGEERKALVFVEDITEIKEREMETEKEKERFQEIFNNINDALYLHSLDDEGNLSNFIEVNEVACEMLGYTREEFMEMSPFDIDSEENKEKMPKVIDELFSKGEATFEGYHISKQGKKIPVELSIHLFEIEGKERVVTAVRDITERKEAEQQLQHEKKRLGVIFESSPSAIFVVDADTKEIVDCNKKAVEISGYSQKEISEISIDDLHPKGVLGRVRRNFEKQIKGEIEVYETKMLTKDGKEIPVRISSSLVETKGQKRIVGSYEDITERREKEKELWESRYMLERAIQEAPFPVMLHAEDGEIVMINKIWTEITGYTKEDIPTMSDWMEKGYRHMEDKKKEKVAKVISGLFEEKEMSSEGKFEVTTKQGEKRIWDFKSVNIGKASDGRALVKSAAVDTTKRDEMEKELREQKEKYQKITEQMNDLLSIIDKNGFCIFANKAHERILGWDPEEDIIGEDIFKLIHPESQKHVKEVFYEKLEKGGAGSVELRLKAKDGSYRFFETEGRVLEDSVLLISRDITERKEAEEKIEQTLRKEKELVADLNKFKLAVENTSNQVVITDSSNSIVYANPAMEEITGYSIDEVVGKTPGELWGGTMDKEFYKDMWKTIREEKKAFTGEIRNHRKNGEEYDVAINISPVLDDEGEIIFYVAISRDITKRKQVEKMKTEFVSIASHQLRTPLTSIKLFAEMLADNSKGLSDKQKEYLENIEESTERMVKLVNDLLNMSRLESGRLEINPEPVDLVNLIKEMGKEMIPAREKKEMDCGMNLPEEGFEKVQVDPMLMRQVVRNLISNALRYTPDEDCKIEVSLEKREDGFLLSVADNGIGIPKSEQGKVFEKFTRANNAQKTKSDGSGLGLYLVKMIIEESGGDIWFESEGEGEGTTFYVKIPNEGMRQKEGEKGLAS